MTARVRFLGSKSQGLATAMALCDAGHDITCDIITLDDRSDARSVLADFQVLGASRGVPVTVVTTRADARAALLASTCDLLVVVGWYWLLADDEVANARCGAVGVHNSVLPAFRGSAPLTWAIMEGATDVGATLFSLGQGMDDGDIWDQVTTPVNADDDIGSILARLQPLAVTMVVNIVPGLLSGTRHAKPQDHARATYGAPRIPDDGVIDWTWTATAIHNFVRAQAAPYPGAFTFMGRRRLTVWRTALLDQHWSATPGQVIAVRESDVIVACGQGTALALLDVEADQVRGAAPRLVRSRTVRFPPVPLLLDAP